MQAEKYEGKCVNYRKVKSARKARAFFDAVYCVQKFRNGLLRARVSLRSCETQLADLTKSAPRRDLRNWRATVIKIISHSKLSHLGASSSL